MVNFTLQPLYPQERNKMPIKWEAGWAPEPVWMFWGKEKFLAHAGIGIQDGEKEKGIKEIKDDDVGIK
jgi:hypothetical protein